MTWGVSDQGERAGGEPCGDTARKFDWWGGGGGGGGWGGGNFLGLPQKKKEKKQLLEKGKKF